MTYFGQRKYPRSRSSGRREAAGLRLREWQNSIEDLLGRIRNSAMVRLFRIGLTRCKTRRWPSTAGMEP